MRGKAAAVLLIVIASTSINSTQGLPWQEVCEPDVDITCNPSIGTALDLLCWGTGTIEECADYILFSAKTLYDVHCEDMKDERMTKERTESCMTDSVRALLASLTETMADEWQEFCDNNSQFCDAVIGYCPPEINCESLTSIVFGQIQSAAASADTTLEWFETQYLKPIYDEQIEDENSPLNQATDDPVEVNRGEENECTTHQSADGEGDWIFELNAPISDLEPVPPVDLTQNREADESNTWAAIEVLRWQDSGIIEQGACYDISGLTEEGEKPEPTWRQRISCFSAVSLTAISAVATVGAAATGAGVTAATAGAGLVQYGIEVSKLACSQPIDKGWFKCSATMTVTHGGLDGNNFLSDRQPLLPGVATIGGDIYGDGATTVDEMYHVEFDSDDYYATRATCRDTFDANRQSAIERYQHFQYTESSNRGADATFSLQAEIDVTPIGPTPTPVIGGATLFELKGGLFYVDGQETLLVRCPDLAACLDIQVSVTVTSCGRQTLNAPDEEGMIQFYFEGDRGTPTCTEISVDYIIGSQTVTVPYLYVDAAFEACDGHSESACTSAS